MKITKLTVTITILVCLTSFSFSHNNVSPKTIDLSGEWGFKLDSANIGKQEKWFAQTFKETVKLPGTTDEYQKGEKNNKTELGSLTRKYLYEGKAWYQREVDIPHTWKTKRIHLFLERTKATAVWVDSKPFQLQKMLLSPHIYNLTEELTPGKHTLTICVDNSKTLFPVGGSHALSDQAQTNWNGIIGKIELQAMDKVFIKSVKLYPDIHNKEVKIIFRIVNPAKKQLTGKIQCVATGFNGNTHNGKKQSFEFSSDQSEIEVTGNYKMGNFACWDEFTPNLYTLSAGITAKSGNNSYRDNIEETFGMVEFKTEGTQFLVNGRVTFLRGKTDCCVFPLTGYPPMTKDDWVRHMSICKDYGINHLRFHSWTPPKAAFEAADIVGIYIQSELPLWAQMKENDHDQYNYQLITGESIFDNYGNHPSFVMFTLGNELGGSRDVMAQLLTEFKKYENRILLAQGSNNYYFDPQQQPGEDFFVSMRSNKVKTKKEFDLRGSFSFADSPDGGIINAFSPNSEHNYSTALRLCSVPTLGHETGQFQSMPNYDEIPKYTGVLEARNFEAFKKKMITRHLFPYWKELFMASGKLSVLCYKADNEMSLRTPDFAGFQILDLQDFPGQGTALVGILDAFMDSKGFVTPEVWKQSCAAQTIQAKMTKFVWQTNEVFKAELIAINYGQSDMANDEIKWSLTDDHDTVVSQGETAFANFKQGKITTAGTINVALSRIKRPACLTLSLSTKNGVKNQYNIWVYPVVENINYPEEIVLASVLDKSTLADLQLGKKVLLLPDSASIVQNSVGGLFTSDYWSYPMFKKICNKMNRPLSPGTLGLLIDNKHPLFRNFPTSAYTDWQWWPVIKKSRPIMLDSTDATYRPIVQVVDNFERCSELGLIFEFTVGKGKLFVCSVQFNDAGDVVLQTLLKSILDYMQSDKFVPTNKISEEKLLEAIYGRNVTAL